MAFESSRARLPALSLIPELEGELEPDEAANEDEALPSAYEDETPEEVHQRLVRWIDDKNIARDVPYHVLSALGQLVCREYDIDKISRADWEDKAKKAQDLAMQKTQPKEYPWEGACLSLDTDILTRTGWKPVADVVVGEEVLSRAPDGTADFFPVTATFRNRAPEVVHLSGKSIDLLVTPNHRMLVTDRDTGESSFIEAGEFVRKHNKGPNDFCLSRKSIPLTSTWAGSRPETVYGIEAKAYVRFLGWYISEGWAFRSKHNRHQLKSGLTVDYGEAWGSFGVGQSAVANPEKCSVIEQDLRACGLTYRRQTSNQGWTVHARSMPPLLKEELRALGKSNDKHIPRHVMNFAPELLLELLDTLVSGDGHRYSRAGRIDRVTYYTTSRLLADQIQELCQKVGMRGTIVTRAAQAGGVINGRPIMGMHESYVISINRKPTIQVLKLQREMVAFDDDVACVEVFPHHTIYVRRNGKAVWVGNSNVIFPLITTASIEFAARAYPAIVQNRNVLKGVVWGSDKGKPATQNGKPDGAPLIGPDGQMVMLHKAGEKKQRAERVGVHMSWQLLNEMEDWEPQTDMLLHRMPIVGGAVRKTFRDMREDRNCSVAVDLMDLVWNYDAPSFEKAPRKTECVRFYPHEIEEFERDDEMFLTIPYGAVDPGEDGQGADPNDSEAPRDFLEQHRRYDLDGDGYDEPLIITVHKASQAVVRITVRYDEDGLHFTKDGELRRIDPVEDYTLYPFLPSLDGGSYPTGIGHLLLSLNDAINSTLNQMFDAGHLQIAGGGFIGAGLSLHAGNSYFSIGEYKPVNNKGMSVKDNVLPLPWPGPNPVLFQLLGLLIESAKEVGAVKDVLTGDASMATTPPTTMLALVQQGMKVYTAIHKRVYRSLKEEGRKLYRLNRLYLMEDQHFQVGEDWFDVSPEDYRLGGGVEPVADPSMVTDMERLSRASVVYEAAKDNPLVNKLEATRRLFDAAQVDKIDDLLPQTMPPPQPSVEQQEVQIKAQTAQSKLGLERAQEMNFYTMAILNFQKARATMSGPQLDWIESQLELMRLHIESLNTAARAGAVDASIHGHNITMAGHLLNHHAHMADVAARAKELSNEQPDPESSGSADNGGGSQSAPALPQPGAGGTDGAGLSALAPQPGNSGIPALPGPTQ